MLERTNASGQKILISGGGRCNFTNIHTRPENFLSQNPHFAKSALSRYSPEDFLALVEQYRIPWHEKKLGQLFCDRSAREIVDMLLNECTVSEVRVDLGCHVSDVSRGTEFNIETNHGLYRAPALVIATGGLSIPKIGATPFGYELARQFGLQIIDPRPALVPLVLNERDRKNWCDLAGVATCVEASCNGARFEERMLVTHRGLSGPAILQISSYWDGRNPVRLDLLPGGYTLTAFGNRSLKALLGSQLPKRLAERWIDLHSTPDLPLSVEALEAGLHAWDVLPSGTEGYAKAEVTAGGVDTSELSSKTMESRRVPGLYFIGEVVDVTGHLGGYNFQWAWSSACAAGQAI